MRKFPVVSSVSLSITFPGGEIIKMIPLHVDTSVATLSERFLAEVALVRSELEVDVSDVDLEFDEGFPAKWTSIST